MSRKKDKFKQPEVRVHRCAVTGVVSTEVIDDVFRAFEKCVQAIEGQQMKLSNGDASRLAAKLEEWLIKAQPHTGGDGS